MTPAINTAATEPADTAPPGADRTPTAPGRGLSLRRLYLLRFGYLVMGGGLAVFKARPSSPTTGPGHSGKGWCRPYWSRCRSWRSSG